MSAIKNLVSEIVDYAGLFPPAKLPLDEVVDNYETYLSSDLAWMLGRLVLPIGKLAEFEQYATFVHSQQHWKISALIPPISDPAFDQAITTITAFNSRQQANNKAVVDNVEIKAPTVELVQQTAESIPAELVAFLELPHADVPEDHIAAIASSKKPNLFAKIRTGGVTSKLIPSANQVANFIVACAKHDVGMKATAGLHHPIRGSYRLTYENDPDFGTMFGFLNVFLAGCFAYAGNHETKFIESVLSETNSSKFKINSSGVVLDGVSVSAEQIKNIRSTKLSTFGSCSFTEPTSELQQIGLINEQISN